MDSKKFLVGTAENGDVEETSGRLPKEKSGGRTPVLATVLVLRMCPKCPHCLCTDALGSNAELMGALAGRADAMFGAIEAKKSTGTLHYHFFLFVQRLQQYASMQDNADALRDGLQCDGEIQNERLFEDGHSPTAGEPVFSEDPEMAELYEEQTGYPAPE